MGGFRFTFSSSTPFRGVLNTFPVEKRTETHAIWRGDLGMGEKTYLLRVWNGLLYFTTAPQSPKTPIWTTFSPVPSETRDSNSLIAWWQNEVAARRFGVVEGTSSASGAGCWDSVVVWGCDGVGQMRPWWDASGGENFAWPNCQASKLLALLSEEGHPPSQWSSWLHRWLCLIDQNGRRKHINGALSEQESDGWQPLPVLDDAIFGQRVLNRARPARWLENRELEWRRGDLASCIALSRAILHCDTGIWLDCPGLESTLRSQSLQFEGYVSAVNPTSWKRLDKNHPKHKSRAYWMLKTLIADFSPLGWKWEKEGEAMPLLDFSAAGLKWGKELERWNCASLRFDFPISAPSHHELLEAQLAVRDWLDFLVQNDDLSREDADLLWHYPPQIREDAEFHARLTGKLEPWLFDD